jgi:hypothetical protein
MLAKYRKGSGMKITLDGFRRAAIVGLVLLIAYAALGAAQTTPNISGRWEVDGVTSGPWVFDLAESSGVITGRVSQHGSLPGPAEIHEGKATGASLTFKIKNPVVTGVTREITFTGRIAENEIAFERTVELLQTGAADNPGAFEMGAFGAMSVPRFIARRVGPVPTPPTPLRPVTQPVDVTGRWESLQWNLDIWYLNLTSSGGQLSGTAGVMAGAPERQAMSNMRPIYDGKIEGNTVSFKAKSQDNVRTMTFVGKAQGDEIVLSRGVELPSGGAVGLNVIFGVYAPNSFVARRVAAAAPPPAAVPSLPTGIGAEISEARKKWAARPFMQYEFTAQWTCICALPPRAFTYQVRGANGVAQINPAVIQFFGMPAQGIQPTIERYNTIDQIFDWLDKQAPTRPFSLKIEYDPTLGYPRTVDLAPVGIATDGNVQLRISGVKALN